MSLKKLDGPSPPKNNKITRQKSLKLTEQILNEEAEEINNIFQAYVIPWNPIYTTF